MNGPVPGIGWALIRVRSATGRADAQRGTGRHLYRPPITATRRTDPEQRSRIWLVAVTGAKYQIVLATVLNTDSMFEPSKLTLLMITAAIKAAISPYSTAVTPF